MHTIQQTLPHQILLRYLCRCKKIIRDVISQHPINLFWHSSIIRTQARLNMPDRNMHLRCSKRSCKNRVGITFDENNIRSLFLKNVFYPAKHHSGLPSLRGRPNPQIVCCLCKIQLLKEDLIHLVRIMLVRMHHKVIYRVLFAIPDYRRHLDDLRTCSKDNG